MANRNAEKVRRRRKKLKDNQTPVAISSQFNSWWFWIPFVVFLLIDSLLIYQFVYNSASQFLIPIIISTIILLLLIVWYLPKFYVRSLKIEPEKGFQQEKELLKLEDDTRKTFAQIIGGAFLLGSLLFTYNTFRLQQEGQFTDRFTKAVEQIGDGKLEVRLGGLYALERIAKDSPKDHWTVMEILSAYVREKSKKVEEEITDKDDDDKNTNKETKESKIATDIQVILTIIGRRKVERDSTKYRIDLSGANLLDANLGREDLGRANFSRVNFSRADLSRADSNRADLSGTNLSEANLSEADLSEVDLSEANLLDANLGGANLSGANLLDANLSGANLSGANFLNFDQINRAIIDENTKLPDSLNSKKAELLKTSKERLKP